VISAWSPLRNFHEQHRCHSHQSTSCRFFGKQTGRDEGTSVHQNKLLKSLAEKLANSEVKNVVVVVGAGASTSAGVPDFRTPGTGLYNRLEKYRLPYPEAIFELDYYKNQPTPFVDLCEQIWPGKQGKVK
jgi:hypothetical protein